MEHHHDLAECRVLLFVYVMFLENSEASCLWPVPSCWSYRGSNKTNTKQTGGFVQGLIPMSPYMYELLNRILHPVAMVCQKSAGRSVPMMSDLGNDKGSQFVTTYLLVVHLRGFPSIDQPRVKGNLWSVHALVQSTAAKKVEWTLANRRRSCIMHRFPGPGRATQTCVVPDPRAPTTS